MSGEHPLPRNLLVVITLCRSPGGVRLSVSERRVMRLTALGLNDDQAAQLLGRSRRWIRQREAAAMKKLGVRKRSALATWAVEHDISPPGDRLSPSEQRALEGDVGRGAGAGGTENAK